MKGFLEIFREKMAPLINRRVEDYALEAAKEWLTQKRQYYHSYPFESDNPNAVVCSVFKELLEDLEK